MSLYRWISSFSSSTNPRPDIQPGTDIESQEASPIECLPVEIFLHVFGFLSIKDLCQASCVCKDWKVLASDDSLWRAMNQRLTQISNLREQYPALTIIDQSFWETYVDCETFSLKFDTSPERPIEECKLLASYCFKEIPKIKRVIESLNVEGDGGITIMTIPKGLTLNKVIGFAQSPKEGNPAKIDFLLGGILAKFGDAPVAKTCGVVITNSILKNSIALDTYDLKGSIKELGCTMPRLLHVVTYAFLTHMSSQDKPPVRPFGDNPPTYTICQEELDGYELYAGSFGTNGIRVTNYVLNNVGIGFGAQLEF